eukprot:CAMPEP_0172919910 /NCGR_PEP_ID=MMETSP1075-20121228/203018_1 /TAXON_ID=2916 /ORGANISM="Ceratium fusus, Strain PA161109" /LENGTH=75 /DNA_ID=CAMNT_0013779835 /DNA_START=249 /DNA_END=476 /DNA_ORIENTATION=-
MFFMLSLRSGGENANWMSTSRDGCMSSKIGTFWYIRDWQSQLAPHMSLVMVMLSIILLMMPTHDELRTSTNKPKG